MFAQLASGRERKVWWTRKITFINDGWAHWENRDSNPRDQTLISTIMEGSLVSRPNAEPIDRPQPALSGGSMRRLVQRLGKFPSCATDMSGEVWPEEAECVAEMQRGTELIAERAYQESTDDYAVSFYWCEPGGKLEYPRCRDSVVMRLMGREVIKPVSCGGGRTWIRFTQLAAKIFPLNVPALAQPDNQNQPSNT